MSTQRRVVTDSMIGLKMPDYSRITPRVATVLGQNPSPFTGPGTNTWIVGTSKRPLLLDTGQGVAIYADLLETALKELSDSTELERIVLTHAHIDHLGGVKQVKERFGEMEVLKMPWEGHDAPAGAISAIGHDAVVHTEGATLRAVFSPGHSPDHLCYYLEEERALFTGDVVLGAGTTVIPDDTGDLGEYMDSLRRLLALDLATIYPAHGPGHSQSQRKDRRVHRASRIARAPGARGARRRRGTARRDGYREEDLHRRSGVPASCGCKLGPLSSAKARARGPRGGA